ncbi:hypothetical protein XAP412_1310031 [Xanthomonas phaseoli pv. phaseoli]|uniref:Uncharacterized protein n=1 Tax=Xanthomonas campestris pv. phaseoli TaxID=317013 RepID=A0AB38DWW2_XANCH|nr:hypothetical protein XAP6984_1330036 [Xanthomonas phaseoli pv. phaseoli]SON79837.1 hypothetical protein XAP412_1310031 [Xanthomonas phaseoli pv. phaseoli]SON82961.1 hypothetical protein XAP7430_1310037 [Xanthomonas phaseoli pv. phaseoli]
MQHAARSSHALRRTRTMAPQYCRASATLLRHSAFFASEDRSSRPRAGSRLAVEIPTSDRCLHRDAGLVPRRPVVHSPTGERESAMADQNGNKGGTGNRGFASMDGHKQREIASIGGKAAHESGNAHRTSAQGRHEGWPGERCRQQPLSCTKRQVPRRFRKGRSSSGGAFFSGIAPRLS